MSQAATPELDQYVEHVYRSNCPSCGGSGPIDVRRAYWVWSAVVLTRWGSETKIECAPCAKPRRREKLFFSLLAGWWGMPFGLILTPVQIIRNLWGLCSRDSGPSAEFRRIVVQNLNSRTPAN
jgi:hypothetical protein